VVTLYIIVQGSTIKPYFEQPCSCSLCVELVPNVVISRSVFQVIYFNRKSSTALLDCSVMLHPPWNPDSDTSVADPFNLQVNTAAILVISSNIDRPFTQVWDKPVDRRIMQVLYSYMCLSAVKQCNEFWIFQGRIDSLAGINYCPP
jgi:hypothetical protein